MKRNKSLTESIGRTIKSVRDEHHWTQTDISSLTGASTQDVAAYEQGRARPPLEFLVKLSFVTGLSLNKIILGKHKNQN